MLPLRYQVKRGREGAYYSHPWTPGKKSHEPGVCSRAKLPSFLLLLILARMAIYQFLTFSLHNITSQLINSELQLVFISGYQDLKQVIRFKVFSPFSIFSDRILLYVNQLLYIFLSISVFFFAEMVLQHRCTTNEQ